MSFNTPNLSAPRFRPTRIGLLDKDLYIAFRKKFPQYKYVSNSELKTIISTFNGLLWETVIESRDGIALPSGMGHLFIGTCPTPLKKNYDMPRSIGFGTAVKHRNFESDNFLAKIFYTNYDNKYNFQHKSIWKFKAVRDFTRRVAKEYPERWKNYLQIDNFAHISRIYRGSQKRDYAKIIDNIISPGYNEFNLS